MLRKSAMYNLKVSTTLAAGGPGGGSGGGPGGLLAVDPQGLTPRTPEILNSLMALDPFANAGAAQPSNPQPAVAAAASLTTPGLGSPSAASGSSGSSGPSSTSPVRSPPSLQHTRSLLIKEGLKLTLQTKRRHTSATSGASASGASADEDDDSSTGPCGKRVKRDELTPEDEERRRRRRERNKVAATKCRIKKRERTVNLVQESEILESQNMELKSQIHELETQRRRLVDMLSSHSPSCTRPGHAHAAAPPPPPPPAYDMYSPVTPTYCCPSPAQPAQPAQPAGGAPPDLSQQGHGGHSHHPAAGYGDILMSQYCHGADAAASAEDSSMSSYFAVTKQEIVDDPLLAGLDDPLDVYAGYPGVDQHPHASPYSCHRLDTPASTPGSDGPAGPHGAMLTGQATALPGPGHPGHHGLQGLQGQHGHYPPHPQALMGSPLTPLPLSPDGVGGVAGVSVYGMDSGCMA